MVILPSPSGVTVTYSPDLILIDSASLPSYVNISVPSTAPLLIWIVNGLSLGNVIGISGILRPIDFTDVVWPLASIVTPVNTCILDELFISVAVAPLADNVVVPVGV